MVTTNVFDTGIGRVELDLSDAATALIRCSGEIDFFTRPALQLHLIAAFALTDRKLRIDLCEARYLGSDVFSCLQAANAQAKSAGRDFALIVPAAPLYDFHCSGYWYLSFRPRIRLEQLEPVSA